MSLKEEEQQLVADALKGVPYAWESLVRRYEGRVYNFGLRLTGNETDAMDLMQEVFMGVYKNLHRFRSESMFSTWLFRIAHNKAVDLARKSKSGLTRSLSDMEGEDAVPDNEAMIAPAQEQPVERLMQKQANAQVRALLSALSFESRVIVELKVFQSYTFDDIAELQGLSPNTVKTRFYSAIRKLKKLLESDYEL
ncbi:MAG: sigma-70 family RNA polymerase sigma factor [Pseudohongiellaceae bacterium]|nr:sigma-70 family RNA polymerase sigma factor [Pseudohongiellaceae bacterium]